MKKWGSLLLCLAMLCGLMPALAETVPDPAGVTLTLYMGTATYTETVRQIAADFEAKTGVKVEWEIPDADQGTSILKARFAGDSAPDMFDRGTNEMQTWKERMMDLSAEAWVAHITPASLARTTIDGQVFAMPYAVEASGIIYNKDLFAQAGIEKLPETLDELEAVCQQLQAAGIQPFGEAWASWGFLAHLFGIPFAYQGDFETNAALKAGEITIGEMDYIDTFFRLYDMTLTYGWGTDSVGYDHNQQIADFASGKMAMIKQGTWFTNALRNANPDLNLGLMAVPFLDDPAALKLQANTTRVLCVANTTKNEYWAKQLLQFIFDGAQTYFVVNVQIMFPGDHVDVSNLGPLFDDANAYLASELSYPTFGYLNWPTGYNAAITEPLQAYAAGAMSKGDCIEELQSQYMLCVEAAK